MSIKNSSNTIGNRTRDLPAYSTVPQPSAPPRDPLASSEHLLINLPTYYDQERSLLARLVRDNKWISIGVRVSGYRYRGLGFDSRRYQIF